MTRVSWIYEEGWWDFDLFHTKAGLPPNQTGPVTHHICPFQHADTPAHGSPNGGIRILGARVCGKPLVIIFRQHESRFKRGWQK